MQEGNGRPFPLDPADILENSGETLSAALPLGANRRRFLNLAGLFVSGGFLAACLGRVAFEVNPIESTKASYKDLIRDSGFGEISSFELSSGIKVSVYSNSPDLLVDPKAFDQSINAVFSVYTDPLLQSRVYTGLLLQANISKNKGQFKGRELSVMVSPVINTCFSADGKTTTISGDSSNGGVCDAERFYRAQVDKQNKPPDSGSRVALIGVSPGADVGSSDKILQYLDRSLSHEGVHMYLRMAGVPHKSSEEDYVLAIEGMLLGRYQKDPTLWPKPFSLRTAE